jgi:hypothetical protein
VERASQTYLDPVKVQASSQTPYPATRTAESQYAVPTAHSGTQLGLPTTVETSTQDNLVDHGEDTEYYDEETQTEPIGAVARWKRLFRLVRRVSFLRRTRYCLTDYVKTFDGIYRRSSSSGD